MTRATPKAAPDISGGSACYYVGRVQVDVVYVLRDGGLLITKYAATHLDQEPITQATRSEINKTMQQETERWHAEAVARHLGSQNLGPGTITLTLGDKSASAQFEDAKLIRYDPAVVEEVRTDLRARRRRRHIDDELLRTAAQVYEAAPSKPTKAVSEHFSVGAAQASRYVALARSKGYLAPLESPTMQEH